MTLKLEQGKDNKILRTASKPVQSVTGELKSFALDMIKTMHTENGVGLAAPQVGRNIRMCICKLNPGDKNEVIVPMINPELLEVSDDEVEDEEGCLSLPGIWGKVKRHRVIIVRYKNLKGQELALELEDFNARIVQHEIDHLNGILFIDSAKNIQKEAKNDEVAHI